MTAYAGCDDHALMTSYAQGTAIGCPPTADFDYPPVVGCPPVGADPTVDSEGHSYGEAAARAVNSVNAQHQSPFYGYVRSGVHPKIYLFPLLEDAKRWFDNHMQIEGPHDYAAVFTATDLRGPISGMEHFNTAGYMGPNTPGYMGPNQAQALIGQWMDLHGPQVGATWMLPVLGIPLGALGGYYYGKWREKNPGKLIPFIGEDVEVGRWGGHAGAQVGGPWMDLVGQDDAVRQQQSMALIQIAIREAQRDVDLWQRLNDPVTYMVWTVHKLPIVGAREEIVTSGMARFDSLPEALEYVRQRLDPRYFGQQAGDIGPSAIAVFDRTSPHWPNPINWHRTVGPQHDAAIASYFARNAAMEAYRAKQVAAVGGPWMDLVGADALAIAKPIAIPVLDEDGNLTGTFVRWFPTQDQISQFGGKRPEFYYDAKGGSFIYNDPRGKPVDVGPYLSPPIKIQSLLYRPTWEVQFIEPSGELTDRETAYKKAEAIYGVAYTHEQLKAEQARMFQDLFGQRASVGGPWMDLVGAQAPQQADVVRRAEWPQTRALIQSAIDDVKAFAESTPAEAYVWVLDTPPAPSAGRAPGSIVTIDPTNIWAFPNQSQALAHLRDVALTRPVALAMFERSSDHWPNPTSWSKSSDPADAQAIAQHIASRSAPQMSGTYLGQVSRNTAVSAAITAVQQRALQLAHRRAGDVVGVIHTVKDGLWHALAFRNEDDADEWLELATLAPETYTYAAYFNKTNPSYWPTRPKDADKRRPVIEKISGMRSPPGTTLPRRSAAVVGAALDDNRARGKQLASDKSGNAVSAILADGLWHVYGFTSLDNAIDWLQSVTREKARFVYAAAYEKGPEVWVDGKKVRPAYIQDEEFGTARAVRAVSGWAA